MAERIRAAVVGLRMGAQHARCYAQLTDLYELVGLCDIDAGTLAELGGALACTALYADYAQMLRETKPELVCVATSDHLHLPMVLAAVDAGAKCVYCEKPIAPSLGDVHTMRKACKDAGVLLIIGHQRRMSSTYRTIRQLLDDGAIGEVREYHASLGGDILCDGTHTVDSILFLQHDRPVQWVLGQIYRGRKATAEELQKNRFLYHGTRYGHSVEEGAMAAFCFEDGVRARIFSGTMMLPHHGYQDIEIIGSKGRIRRAGDGAEPAVQIDDGSGWRDAGAINAYGEWEAHKTVAEALRKGTPHPMDIDTAIKGYELIIGILESARLCQRLELPVTQLENPIDILLREGAMV